jgi:hypothetical protein
MYEFPLVKISGATPTSGSPSLPSIRKPTMLCLRNGSPPLVTVRAIGCSLVQLTPKLEVISDVQELELTETSSAASIGAGALQGIPGEVPQQLRGGPGIHLDGREAPARGRMVLPSEAALIQDESVGLCASVAA